MKALTLTQPWATLVAIGAKHIETRSWPTSYQGPLAIHAAKGFPADARDFVYAKLTRDCLLNSDLGLIVERGYYEGGGIAPLDKQLPRGVVLATCKLIGCSRTEATICLPGVFDDYPELDTPQERAFGNYEPGRWAWILADIKPLATPIPANGSLGLWEWGQ